MTPEQTHDANLDAAQRELDRRNAEGQDVRHLRVNPLTYAIEQEPEPLRYERLGIHVECVWEWDEDEVPRPGGGLFTRFPGLNG